MDLQQAFQSFLNPPILFFFLGMCASFLGVDISIPNQIAKFISLYLLLAIGFHGGFALRIAGISVSTLVPLLAAIIVASLITIYVFYAVKKKLGVYNAAALAATYGSVSAVTFVTATSFLDTMGVVFSGSMIAAMALMETPAIIIGLFLIHCYAKDRTPDGEAPSIIRKALLDPSVYLILGSLLIGFLTGVEGMKALHPFVDDIFKGMLTFFTLEMGLIAANRLKDMRHSGAFLIFFALFIPIINGCIGLGIAKLLALSVGDGFLFVVLCASASYIAVPAALRLAVPEASPSIYIPTALGLTLPFNLLVGLPIYFYVAKLVLG